MLAKARRDYMERLKRDHTESKSVGIGPGSSRGFMSVGVGATEQLDRTHNTFSRAGTVVEGMSNRDYKGDYKMRPQP